MCIAISHNAQFDRIFFVDLVILIDSNKIARIEFYHDLIGSSITIVPANAMCIAISHNAQFDRIILHLRCMLIKSSSGLLSLLITRDRGFKSVRTRSWKFTCFGEGTRSLTLWKSRIWSGLPCRIWSRLHCLENEIFFNDFRNQLLQSQHCQNIIIPVLNWWPTILCSTSMYLDRWLIFLIARYFSGSLEYESCFF